MIAWGDMFDYIYIDVSYLIRNIIGNNNLLETE